MGKSIKSELIGLFTFNETCKAYQQKNGEIHWQLDIRNEYVDVNEMIKSAEKLFLCIEEFDKKAKVAIAEKLINYKNDFWPEYDENDEHLNWDAVDAGEYDITKKNLQKQLRSMKLKLEKMIYTVNIMMEIYLVDT